MIIIIFSFLNFPWLHLAHTLSILRTLLMFMDLQAFGFRLLNHNTSNYSSQHWKWIKKVHQSCPKTRTGIVVIHDERFWSLQMLTTVTASRRSHRADVQWEDEDDEEAQEPGEEGGEQDHPMLLVKVSIAVQQEEREEEHHHHLQRERHATHPDCSLSLSVTCNPSDWHKTRHQHKHCLNRVTLSRCI